ncbi:hypothetical protein CYR52_05065 [Chimaeribacter arupi]|nr:hypothetical protein CYR52_05065 [Chimaeribacter arupi]
MKMQADNQTKAVGRWWGFRRSRLPKCTEWESSSTSFSSLNARISIKEVQNKNRQAYYYLFLYTLKVKNGFLEPTFTT